MASLFIAGCVGGVAGVLAGHPLDTIKVRLQTQTPGRYRGTFDCFYSIVGNEGVFGLFKGISSPLVTLSFSNAIIFGVYGYTIKLCDDRSSTKAQLIAGASAGFLQSFLATPMEFLKLRIQIQENKQNPDYYHSSYDCLRKTIQTRGVRHLFRGLIITQLRDIPSISIYFASYEYIAYRFSDKNGIESLSNLQLLFAGGMAGMLSWLLNYPIDVIKTTFQSTDHHKSYHMAFEHIYRTYGVRGFFTGFGAAAFRAFPCNAAIFFTVEWMHRFMRYAESILETSFTRNVTFGSHHSWDANYSIMGEAGSTYIDPMIHCNRFI